MTQHLSPSATPLGVKVKRLNRNPALLVTGLALLVLSVFAYIIIQSGNRQRNTVEAEEEQSFVYSSRQADSFLAGKPEHGVIKESVKTPPQAPAKPQVYSNKTPAITPAPNTQPTELEQEIARIKAAKLKKLEQAVSAPSSGGGSTGTSLTSTGKQQNDLSSLLANRVQGMGGNPALPGNVKDLIPGLHQEELDPNKQQQKKIFYMEEQPSTEYLDHTRTRQVSPLEVKTGTIIPATMLTGLNSDLPGMILAQVSQNVYDTATGRYLLIPQGSRLVGSYDNFISYGQNRALVAWSRMVYPDGSTLELKGMPGTDQKGFAGLEDQVDNHYFRVFGSALLMSVISGIYESTQDDDQYSYTESVSDSLGKAVAREMNQVSMQLLRKNLNIQPTIKIRPGYRLNVMVNKDIIFPIVW